MWQEASGALNRHAAQNKCDAEKFLSIVLQAFGESGEEIIVWLRTNHSYWFLRVCFVIAHVKYIKRCGKPPDNYLKFVRPRFLTGENTAE